MKNEKQIAFTELRFQSNLQKNFRSSAEQQLYEFQVEEALTPKAFTDSEIGY